MQSMSMSAGEHNERHNIDADYRAKLPNVDHEKTKDNENIRTETIERAYERIFGAATERFNARCIERGHPERCIDSYLSKVRREAKADAKKKATGEKWRKGRPDPCVEFVGQVGSHDTWARDMTEEEAKEILRETFKRIDAKTAGHIDWFQVAIHVDEPNGTPHIHMCGIPLGRGYTRGLDVQVSMRKAMEGLGLKKFPELQQLFLDELTKVAQEHGIEREVMDCDRGHLPTRDWEQYQDSKNRMGKDIEDTSERLECLRQGERDAQAEARELDEQIAEAELQPVQESVGESLGNLVKGRGLAGREAELADEVEGLRSRVAALEGEKRGLEREIPRLERRVHELERGLRSLGERLEGLLGRWGALGRGYVANVGQKAAEALTRLGIRAYAGNAPLDVLSADARRAADIHSHERGRAAPSRGGLSR